MKPCHEYAALLDLYVDGELSPQEMVQVQEHLDLCPGCQAYVDDALAIRAAFPEVEDTEVPEGFAESVCAVIQASDTAPKRNRRRRWAKTLLPMAACCAIVVLLSRLPAAMGEVSATTESAAITEEDASAGRPKSILPDNEAALYSDDTDSAGSDAVTPASQAPMEDAADAAPKTNTTTALAPQPEESRESGDSAPNARDEATEAPESNDSAAEEDPSVNANVYDTYGEDVWVENGNVVFSAVVYLSEETVGDALDGFEGKPYSNANLPEEGVIGIGYAMEQEDFEHILYDVLDYPLGPTLNPSHTTELSCIVVTAGDPAAPAESPEK